MMRRISRIFAAIIVFAMCLGMIPVFHNITVPAVGAEVFSGEIEGWTFFFDDETGTLVIIGKGPMPSFKDKPAPWSIYADRVTRLICDDGITSISENAFANFTKLESIALPATIEIVDKKSFTGCEVLKSIEFAGEPEKLQKILEENKVEVTSEISVSAVSTTGIETLINEVVEKVNPEMPSAYQSYVDAGGQVAVNTISEETQEISEPQPEPEPEPEIITEPEPVLNPVHEEYKYYTSQDGGVLIEKYVDHKLVYIEYVSRYSEVFTTWYTYAGDKIIKEENTTPYESYCVNYEYENDKVIRVTQKSNEGTTVTSITYDGDNRTETLQSSGGYATIAQYEGEHLVSVNEYDRKGRLTYSTEYTEEGMTSTTTWISYSSSGKEMFRDSQVCTSEVTESDEDGKIISITDTYTYIHNGKVTEINKSTTEYSYDEDGSIKEEKHYRYNGEAPVLEGQYRYVYENGKILSRDYTNDDYSSHEVFEYSGDALTRITDTDQNTVTDFTYTSGLVSKVETNSDHSKGTTVIERSNGSVHTVKYAYSEEDKAVNNTERQYRNNRLISSNEVTYDEGGRVQESRNRSYSYNEDGSLKSQKNESTYQDWSYTYENTYNGNQVISYNKDTYKNRVASESTSISIDGVRVSELYVSYNDDSTKHVSSHEYDENGNHIATLTEKYDKYGNKKSIDRVTYEYDEYDRQIQRVETSYDKNEKLLSSSVCEYAYDKNGYQNESTATYYDKNGAVKESRIDEYVYDEKGNQTAHRNSCFDKNGALTSTYEYVTLYDEEHNRVGNQSKDVYYHSDNCRSEYEYTYDENYGTTLAKYSYYRNDKLENYRITEYVNDEHGNEVKKVETYYNSEDRITSITETEYTRNEKGKATEKTVKYYTANSQLKSYSTTEYLFDAYENEIGSRYVSYNADGIITNSYLYEYIFDAQGERISQKDTEYNSQGKKVRVYEPLYNDDGIQTGTIETYYDNSGTIVKLSRTENQFDEKGLCTGSKTYDKNGNMTSEHCYQYDEDGKKIGNTYKYYIYNKNGKLTGSSETQNIYDDEGREIGDVYKGYDANGNMTSLTEHRYDEAGNKIYYVSTDYDKNGNATTLHETQSEYTDDGKLSKVVAQTTYQNGSVTIRSSEYVYNENGKQTGYETVVLEDGVQISSVKTTYEYSDTGEQNYRITSYYGKDGNLTSAEDCVVLNDESGNQIATKSTYYDKDGNVTSSSLHENLEDESGDYTGYKTTYYDQDGNIKFLEQYEYLNDDSGYRIGTQWTYFDKDGNVESAEKNVYITDESGYQTGSKTTYYDATGNVTSSNINEDIYDQDGNTVGKRYTSYDADGNVTNSYTDYYDGYNPTTDIDNVEEGTPRLLTLSTPVFANGNSEGEQSSENDEQIMMRSVPMMVAMTEDNSPSLLDHNAEANLLNDENTEASDDSNAQERQGEQAIADNSEILQNEEENNKNDLIVNNIPGDKVNDNGIETLNSEIVSENALIPASGFEGNNDNPVSNVVPVLDNNIEEKNDYQVSEVPPIMDNNSIGDSNDNNIFVDEKEEENKIIEDSKEENEQGEAA